MTQWIIRTRGEYPHLLPHLVESVVSKKRVGEGEMDWVVEMTDQELEAVRHRTFVESIEPAPVSASR